MSTLIKEIAFDIGRSIGSNAWWAIDRLNGGVWWRKMLVVIGGLLIANIIVAIPLRAAGLEIDAFDLFEFEALVALFAGLYLPERIARYFFPNASNWIIWGGFWLGCLLGTTVLLQRLEVGRWTIISFFVAVTGLAIALWRWVPGVSKTMLIRMVPFTVLALYWPLLPYLPLVGTYPVEFKVRHFEREADKGTYVIQTDYGAVSDLGEGESFLNGNFPRLGIWDSDNRQGLFAKAKEKDLTVRCWVTGFRFAPLKLYRKIVSIEVLPESTPTQ